MLKILESNDSNSYYYLSSDFVFHEITQSEAKTKLDSNMKYDNCIEILEIDGREVMIP